jgi:acetyl-CoA synthetase
VINVSGHRISTAEVEAALGEHPAVAESAVVSIPDELTGEALAVFVTIKDDDSFPLAPSHENEVGHAVRKDALKKTLIKHVRDTIGPFAAPKKLTIVPDLPKTRSGKIMRRILRKIASGDVKDGAGVATLGDLSTLADPDLIPQLIKIVHDIPVCLSIFFYLRQP